MTGVDRVLPAPRACAALVTVLSLLCAPNAGAQAPPPGTDSGGIQPGREYFSPEPYEHFDTQTGNLILRFTELVLPGNAGRDLRIVRAFNNFPNAGWALTLDGYVMQIDGGGFLPVGQPVNFNTPGTFLSYAPRLITSDGATKQTFFLQTPDTGSAETMLGSMGWVQTVDHLKYNQWTRTLYMPDGRACQYDHTPGDPLLRFLSYCDDPFGNRMFEIIRTQGSMTIRQHLGSGQVRDVVLSWSGGGTPHGLGLPDTMASEGRTWTYGKVDGQLTTVTPPAGPAWQFDYVPQGQPGWGFLKRVTTPAGGQIEYAYQHFAFTHPEQPLEQQYHGDVLISRTSHDGISAVPPTTVAYEFFYNPAGDVPAGAPPVPPALVRVTTPVESLEYLACAGGQLFSPNPELGEYIVGNTGLFCGGPVRGYPASELYHARPFMTYPEGIALFRAERRWRKLRNCESFTPAPGTGCLEHTTEFLDYDAFQNVGRILETGPFNAAQPGNPTQRETTRTYLNVPGGGGTPYLLGFLRSETVTVAGQSFTTTFDVDSTTGFRWSETAGGIVTLFTPDAFGNIETSTRDDQETAYQYSWGQVSRIQTLEHTVTRTINSDGTVASEEQAGRTTTYAYDGLGRRILTQPPGGTLPTITSYNGGNEIVTSRGASRVRTTLDGLGRPIRTETGDTGGYTARTVTRYDAIGRKNFAGYPMPAGTPEGQDIGTAIEYDVLSRVTRETNPDDSFRQRSYGVFTTASTDEEGRTSVITRQMFGNPDEGRISRLVDAAGETWTYGYNVLGSLTGVAGPGGVTRTWTYHPGSLLPATETHPESGTVHYTHYDAAGILRRKVDANGTEFLYTPDGNGRIRTITAAPAGGPPQMTVIDYEPGSDRRQEVDVDGVVTRFQYDTPTGRLESRTDSLDGLSFTTTYEYDASDNLTRLTYPSGRQIRYEYDGQNRIAQVVNHATGQVYASGFDYHASGALSTYVAGNNVATTLFYHPTRQWLDAVLVGEHEHRLQLTYAYDGVGNITGIADWRPDRSQTFGYDALDRLTLASAPGFYNTLEYTYDAHGNRQTGNGVTYGYDPANPFRLQSIGGALALTYDANGNLRGGFGGQYDYTADNRLAVSTTGSATTRFTYDADAWRLKKAVDGGPTTYFVRGPGGQLLSEVTDTSPPTTRDYIYAGSRLVAVATRHDAPGGAPTVATPAIAPPGGTFAEPVSVSLATTTAGAAIHYTTDGSTPTEASALYTAPFTVSATGTVRARGYTSGMQPSGVASAAFTIGGGGGPSLSATPATVAAGGTLTVAWSGLPAPSALDWLSLYVPGAPPEAYGPWMYVSCATVPDVPRPAGDCPFAVPPELPPGPYELRLLADEGFTVVVTSPGITVTGAGGPALSAAPATVSAGSAVTGTWSGLAAPTATDWVGLYAAGSADWEYLEWVYVSCTQVPDGPRAAGSCAVPVPAWVPAGPYELRLFADDGWIRLATSHSVTVE